MAGSIAETYINQKRPHRKTGMSGASAFIYAESAEISAPVLFSHYIVYYEGRPRHEGAAGVAATPLPDIIFWSTPALPRFTPDISSVASSTYEFI